MHSTHVATVLAMQNRLIIRINHYSALTSAVDPRSAILLPETCPFSREQKIDTFSTSEIGSTRVEKVFTITHRLLISINHNYALNSPVNPRFTIYLLKTCPFPSAQNKNTFYTSATDTTHLESHITI